MIHIVSLVLMVDVVAFYVGVVDVVIGLGKILIGRAQVDPERK